MYLKRRQCTLSLTSNGCFVPKGSLGAGSFGAQWTFMKKDFNRKFKAEGQREYRIMERLNTLDKEKNGDGGKHIVTVQNVPSKWKGGFAFTTPLALCSLAEFQQDRSRVTGLTNGIILKSLVQGVEFLHENHYAHGDIKPANVLVFSVFSKPEVRLTDFGNSPHKVRGSASGTCGYRYPWPDWIDIFSGDWWSLGLLTGGLFLTDGKRLLSDEAIIGLGQKSTKQQRFWKFLEVKLGQPASVYLPYLRPVLKRDAQLRVWTRLQISCWNWRKCASADSQLWSRLRQASVPSLSIKLLLRLRRHRLLFQANESETKRSTKEPSGREWSYWAAINGKYGQIQSHGRRWSLSSKRPAG